MQNREQNVGALIINSSSDSPVRDRTSGIAATVGFFDGVHRGHRFLLDELKRLAAVRGLKSAVITFPAHPRIVLRSDYQPELLNAYEEKLELLADTGIDYITVMDFTPELAEYTAERFIKEMLYERLNVKMLLTGYDHRFGHLRSEGFEQYLHYGRDCGVEIVKASQYTAEGTYVSSSAVRRLLSVGDVSGAASLLGYRYRLTGKVVEGNGIGRSLGFPTANIAVNEMFKIIPKNGSYAVLVYTGGKRYEGMCYIGSRPTIGGEGFRGYRFQGSMFQSSKGFLEGSEGSGAGRSVEVNIFGLNGDIYGETLTVEFVAFIREETKYGSTEALVEALQRDKEQAITNLNKVPNLVKVQTSEQPTHYII